MGAYLGLTPRCYHSGEVDRAGHISRWTPCARIGRPLGAEPGRDDAADAALAELARQRAAMVPAGE